MQDFLFVDKCAVADETGVILQYGYGVQYRDRRGHYSLLSPPFRSVRIAERLLLRLEKRPLLFRQKVREANRE